MNVMLASTAFVIAALCAAIMGFAIQRGATCTVAAVDEVVTRQRFGRLVSMVEASLWVLGGLLLAQVFHLLGKVPAGYAINVATVAGGALLGLGAYVNRACVFGAIARLGSGEWAYVVTPIGFYVGCLTVESIFSAPAPVKLEQGSPVLQASWWMTVLFAAFMIARVIRPLLDQVEGSQPDLPWWRRLRLNVARRVWSPHAATAVIGVTFFFMLLLVGAWAYTDVLAELAHGMANSLIARSVLLLALFGGAVFGGIAAGRFKSTPVSVAQVVKCFCGGVLMGWGSLLIPGGNDGLILVGMPLLWPYAWVAFAAMCVTIAIAQIAHRSLERAIDKRAAQEG